VRRYNAGQVRFVRRTGRARFVPGPSVNNHASSRSRERGAGGTRRHETCSWKQILVYDSELFNVSKRRGDTDGFWGVSYPTKFRALRTSNIFKVLNAWVTSAVSKTFFGSRRPKNKTRYLRIPWTDKSQMCIIQYWNYRWSETVKIFLAPHSLETAIKNQSTTLITHIFSVKYIILN